MSDPRPTASPEPRIGMASMSPAMLEIPQYYRWMFERFAGDLGDTVLDVGTGPGIHLPLLEGRRVIAVDLSEECLRAIRERCPWVETVQGDVSDPVLAGRLAGRNVDTITCLNVLEHIPDDAGAVAAFRFILLRRAGRLVLVVPAHPALYGDMDRLASHLRRYTLGGLVGLLETQGFTCLRANHFNVLGGAAWYLNARLLRVGDLSAPAINRQIRLFGRFGLPVARLADALFHRLLRLPFGQSIIVVATPRGGDRR